MIIITGDLSVLEGDKIQARWSKEMKLSIINFGHEPIHSFAYGEKKCIASKEPCTCERYLAVTDLRRNLVREIYESNAA